MQAPHAAKGLGKLLRAALSNVANPKAIEQPGKAALFAGFNGGHQFGGRFLPLALERRDLLLGEVVKIGDRSDETLLDKLLG